MFHANGAAVKMGRNPWLALAGLLLASASHASGFNPDAGAAFIIVADVLVTGKAILSPPPPQAPVGLAAVSAGAFDVGAGSDPTPVFAAEYRFGGQHFWNSQPVIGFAATARRSIYGYGGLRFNVSLPYQMEIASTFALAGYSRGNGKNLGSAKEAYFELSVGRRFANDMRIELAARHLSHDDLFSSYDPGVDIVAISLALPVR